MSTVKTNNVQVGLSGTATNNFTWYQPASPDGTVRLGIGNSGATSGDVLRATSGGAVLAVGGGGMGYGTGAGGAVTQATSRTTTVTIDKPTGAITMFSAAGSATPASFTVTNSTVTTTDVVVLNIKSGATNTYVMSVTAVNAGTFVITFYTTGGTSTDAPVINFAVIKGVAT